LPGPGSTTPRETTGITLEKPRAKRFEIMTQTNQIATSSIASRRTADRRKSVTFDMAAQLCPHEALADNIARTFGLDAVDSAGIREATEEHIALSAKLLPLSDKALEMHLQRVVGSFVGSAFGAGQFYSSKVSQAREITARLSNDDRDEDRDGVSGFDSRAERARNFAADMGLQAHALLCAAQGAVSAYEHLTGQEWRPYEAQQPSYQQVSRASAAAQMAAFETP
jgi:hypothetical protein